MNLSKTTKTYFKIAKDVSLLSNHEDYKLGCVVINKHKIVSSGCNSRTKCRKLQADLDYKYFNIKSKGAVHAEIDALLPLLKRDIDLSNASIYTYREDKHGHIAMSRPCPRCMEIIKKCGIKKINYTTYDGYVFEKLGENIWKIDLLLFNIKYLLSFL